ncbi:MAG: glutamine synthetase type III [Bacteroidetes bacterium 4572_114]|nr:MAG: glutamine synthetase type III [Bacteroidetes bacterium 4572_114]
MLRIKALESITEREPKKTNIPKGKISDYFGQLTFNDAAMREYLTREAYEKVMNAISFGEKIERRIADQVAASLKAWAIGMGATHYTHWFHPLTGSTAEKHDAFINPVTGGKAIENFRGTELIQQEPDASSFPSGGIRNTFEARGYTAWDPTSPAFLLDNTLCIPTIFVSYTGEALDFKTPMLKALNIVDSAAVDVCKYFDKDVNKVVATLGWEQEYFLIDTALFNARPDLVLTGRTVFGHASAKDQQLSDHYFGTIPARVMEFMKEFEYEAHKLGIPVKTRHNEVAPNQFECAPVFEEANLAVDHNQLLMHLIKRIANRHNFTVLLHEKPYAGVNGSGKHNNWSLMTNTGINLLSPGKDSKSNLRFLTFLVNILKALHSHADLIRSAIASAGNDHRLGAHEAPPAIISAFIGTQLTKVLNELEKQGKIKNDSTLELNLNIPKIPEILLDNTDRNRTSPFAFTGNKFEFRAVGSSATCSKAMTPLNLILADQLIQFKNEVDGLITKGVKKKNAILQVLRRYVLESKNIRFEGNSYGEEWAVEAGKRGLSNFRSTPDALIKTLSQDTIDLYEKHSILTKREMVARHEIKMEKYAKQIQIEARVLGDLATNHIIPVAIQYQNILIENVKGLKDVLDHKTFVKLSKSQVQSIKDISEHISGIKENVIMMIDERKTANKIDNEQDKALFYNKKVLPYFELIRYHVDKLELLVDDRLWPLPKYRELLFLK